MPRPSTAPDDNDIIYNNTKHHQHKTDSWWADCSSWQWRIWDVKAVTGHWPMLSCCRQLRQHAVGILFINRHVMNSLDAAAATTITNTPISWESISTVAANIRRVCARKCSRLWPRRCLQNNYHIHWWWRTVTLFKRYLGRPLVSQYKNDSRNQPPRSPTSTSSVSLLFIKLPHTWYTYHCMTSARKTQTRLINIGKDAMCLACDIMSFCKCALINQLTAEL